MVPIFKSKFSDLAESVGMDDALRILCPYQDPGYLFSTLETLTLDELVMVFARLFLWDGKKIPCENNSEVVCRIAEKGREAVLEEMKEWHVNFMNAVDDRMRALLELTKEQKKPVISFDMWHHALRLAGGQLAHLIFFSDEQKRGFRENSDTERAYRFIEHLVIAAIETATEIEHMLLLNATLHDEAYRKIFNVLIDPPPADRIPGHWQSWINKKLIIKLALNPKLNIESDLAMMLLEFSKKEGGHAIKWFEICGAHCGKNLAKWRKLVSDVLIKDKDFRSNLHDQSDLLSSALIKILFEYIELETDFTKVLDVYTKAKAPALQETLDRKIRTMIRAQPHLERKERKGKKG